MSTWLYKGRPFKDNKRGHYGFIYHIIYECGKEYIGQKAFLSKQTLPAKKDGIPRPNSERVNKRKPMTREDLFKRNKAQVRQGVKSKLVPYDVVSKESNWKTYNGSSQNAKGLKIKEKHIIHLCPTKRNMTYMETKLLFENNVLEEGTNFINDNILGKFYVGAVV